MLTSQVLAKHMSYSTNELEERTTQRSRFDSEHALVSFFEQLIGQHTNQGNTSILREFDSPNGIADIVVFELHNQWEKSLALKDVPPRWAYWLYSLPYPECFKTEDASRIAGVTHRQANTFLNLITEVGFCEKVGSQGTWRVVFQPKPFVEDFYAIEAKLRDWKRALSQASRYRDYAVQSWVLLDEHAVRPALDNIKLFERLNIGLATIACSAEVTVHFLPYAAAPRSQLRYWQANAEAARRFALDATDLQV